MPSTGTTLQLLPERIDLPTLVLTAAGLGALAGTLLNRMGGASREQSTRRTEDFALVAAASVLMAVLAVAFFRAIS